jgi:predicted metal-dependent phosphoesterase TrpH
MQIKVDFHVHTSFSVDGVSNLAQIVARAKKLGIEALAICDHNQWFTKARLDEYQQNNILLLPGCEFSTNYGHLLGIFFDFTIPFETIAATGMVDFDLTCDRIHELGGVCILAHPFQSRNCQVLNLHKIDAIEVFNARSAFKYKEANIDAAKLAERYNIRGISASDAHSKWEIGNSYTILEVEEKSLSAIKQGLMARGEQHYSKNTLSVYKGISQWVKKVRQKRYRELPKAFIYLCYCITKDIFRY